MVCPRPAQRQVVSTQPSLFQWRKQDTLSQVLGRWRAFIDFRHLNATLSVTSIVQDTHLVFRMAKLWLVPGIRLT
jgi:hypothetical protein